MVVECERREDAKGAVVEATGVEGEDGKEADAVGGGRKRGK